MISASLAGVACSGSSIPSPKDAVSAYANAAARGDADAIYEMMSEKGKRALTREEVKKIVADERAELTEEAKQITAPGVGVKARARVRYPDGEDAALELDEQGTFKVGTADALPAGARSPDQALDQLRRVLARRSYAGLIRLLSPATRSMIENDLRSLVEGLEHPEGLDVAISGDNATVQVPGGHEVKLHRDGGVWFVDDFN
jgi:hypothetical protein